MPDLEERRKGRERRSANLGPPSGCGERRRCCERRAMSVSEIEISPEEWERYFANKGSAQGDHAAERAARSIERIRR